MSTVLRLKSFLLKYKKWLILSAVSHILMALFTIVSIPMVIPFFKILFYPDNNTNVYHSPSGTFEKGLDHLFTRLIETQGNTNAMIIVCVCLVIAFFLRNVFRYLSLTFMAPLRNGIVRDLRGQIHHKYLFFNRTRERSTGDLISRATQDVQEVDWSVLSVLEAVFKSPFILIGSLGFMLLMSVKLTLIALGLMVFIGIVISGISRKLKSISHSIQSKAGDLTSTFEETLHGWKIIQIFTAQNYRTSSFQKENDNYYQQMNQYSRRRELSSPLSEFLGVSTVVVLLWLGSDLVFKKELLPETFFAFILAFYQLIEPSKQLSNALFSMQKGSAALDRIFEILNIPERSETDQYSKTKLNFSKDLVFNDVSFVYPGSAEPALRNINLKIIKGQKIGITGFSGSGKSTFADLLLKLSITYSGDILLDGTNIKDIPAENYRKLFGYVPQEGVLFKDTIAGNVALNDKIDENALKAALHSADAFDFIYQKPDNIFYKSGEKGSELSGGEKQRITIARALYHQPDIMIFDESTSSLDAQSEEVITKTISQISENKTVIFITHKLSLLKKMDIIYVFSDGTIAEEGNYDFLTQNGKHFQKLAGIGG